MAGFDSTNLGGLIVRVYSKDKIRRLQNLMYPVLGSIKNSTRHTVAGEGFYFGVKTSGGESIGFRDPTAQLPSARKENVQQAKVTPKPIYGTLEVSGLAKALASGQPHSFAEVMSYDITEKTDELSAYMEGALFRDKTDKLGEVESVNGNTITVNSPGVQWLREGMKVDFIDTSGTATKDGATIEEVDWETNTIVVDAAGSAAPTDGVYLDGTHAGSGTFRDAGFDGLVAGTATTGTYLGLSRSTYPTFQGNLIDATDSLLDEDLLTRLEVRVMQVGGVSRSSIRNFRIYSHFNQVRKLAEVAYPRQRFNGNNVSLGVDKLSWKGNEIMESPFCPETDVFCGDSEEFQKFVTPNGELQISTDFGDAWKFVPNFDAGRAYMRAYCNYVVTNPRKWGRLKNLANVSTR